jgi:hypothetical protein
VLCATWVHGATTRSKYFAHDAVEDRNGVIAPWYSGQNGQFDLRVRVAAETLKRYPWATADKSVSVVPDYMLNGTWAISPEGVISKPPLNNWTNGDLGQIAARDIEAFITYYRYSGDPDALARVSLLANNILAHCQTSADNPWPNFLISVPVTGKPYGNCDAKGWIQLDIVGETAMSLIHAYELLGERRWLEAAEHWADVLVEKRDRQPGTAPWGRYANPQDVKWGKDEAANVQAGGIVYELTFFDELIRLGYTGKNNALVEARDAARAYLRDFLLPRWTVNETFGRNYWDWPDPVQSETTTNWMTRYLIANKTYFKNWKNDVRNMLSIYLNHTTVSPKSQGEVYSGAWALPESSGCCRTSLAWASVDLGSDFALYARETQSEWAKEIARRQLILGTYDFHTNGVAEDNILGGDIAAGGWFMGAHPSILLYTLQTMGWLPAVTGAARENHIMRSTSIVTNVDYSPRRLSYSTFDAPAGGTEVLRLAFKPQSINAGGRPLQDRSDLSKNGYTVAALEVGDYLVEVRHDGVKQIAVHGSDPALTASNDQVHYEGSWKGTSSASAPTQTTQDSGSAVTYAFDGNQVRLFGDVSPKGGLADVFLDNEKQLAGIDFWNTRNLHHQVVYYTSGLANGHHQLKIVSRGAGNPLAHGHEISVDELAYSAANGSNSFGEGGGPSDTQRLIFGYTGRNDYVDMDGNAWRPGMEFVARTGDLTDVVAKTWWTMRQAVFIKNTRSQELYRYGIHWPDFVVNITVAPGTYHVKVHLAETQFTGPGQRSMSILVNEDPKTEGLDVFSKAGGADTALQIVYNDIRPKNGVIAIRFKGDAKNGTPREAMVQAIEVGPGTAEVAP